MKLGENGIAFFVEEINDKEEGLPDHLTTHLDKCSREGNEEEASKKATPSVDEIGKEETIDPKQMLPFSSSIFSYRRYRSLPDLVFLATQEEDKRKQSSQAINKRKLTTIDPPKFQQFNKLNAINMQQTKLPEIIERPNRVSTKINVLESESEDEEVIDRKPVPPHHAVLDDEGAFSDSEVDHHTVSVLSIRYSHCVLAKSNRLGVGKVPINRGNEERQAQVQLLELV